jgi:acetyl esterase/lipase
MIMPPFVSSYEKYCKQHKLTPNIVDIPNTNNKGFWIGNPESAKYAMVYYHGGGFVLPGMPPHLDMLPLFVKWSGGNLAVFCNAYTLAPEGLYPLQIGESVEALRYVLSLPGRKPETTLLGGDSAGGNLVLAVLSHISGHPHPNSKIVKPLQLSPDGQKLHGAVMIAPWVSSDVKRFKSMTQFARRDTVNGTCANYWIETYKGGASEKDDEYIVPELAPASWWSGTENTLSSTLVTAGEHEALRDAILAFTTKFKEGTSGGATLKVVVGKKEVHDAPLGPKPDAELDRLGDACQEAAIRTWIQTRCGK